MEVAHEFEDSKNRQLDLYQRQLRRSREQLEEKETQFTQLAAELEFQKNQADKAATDRHQETDDNLALTREVVVLKMQLADAIEAALLAQALYKHRRKPGDEDEDEVFAEPTMPADVLTTKEFKQLAGSGDEAGLRTVLSPLCVRQVSSSHSQDSAVAQIRPPRVAYQSF